VSGHGFGLALAESLRKPKTRRIAAKDRKDKGTAAKTWRGIGLAKAEGARSTRIFKSIDLRVRCISFWPACYSGLTSVLFVSFCGHSL
jgi:hypothetical protein